MAEPLDLPPGDANNDSARLWSPGISPASFTNAGEEKYILAILEQYKLYVGAADRISDRRMLANNFFLTLNSGVAAGIGFLISTGSEPARMVLGIIASAAALALCVVWTLLLRSYRDLNTAKFTVIGDLEKKLPASPYWSAEWHRLAQGKKRATYWPLSHLEMAVPAIVAILHAGLIVMCVYLYIV